MPKQQVMEIMGDKSFGEIENPYRRETFMLGSDTYEVLYYYTDFIQVGQPLDTGMTPIIFKNGKFIGSGKEFFSKVR